MSEKFKLHRGSSYPLPSEHDETGLNRKERRAIKKKTRIWISQKVGNRLLVDPFYSKLLPKYGITS